MSTQPDYDLAIIGSGPAGLAAATLAARQGASVVLIDEQAAPGGQIYRAITTTPVKDPAVLGADYWHGESLIEPFKASGAHYQPGTVVWSVNQTSSGSADTLQLACSHQNKAQLITTRHLIVATGAQERPFPIPGWTLPGVITAGAAQIMLKTSGLVPDARAVLAGCGPLLYLLASQYLAAGVKLQALLDTTPKGQLRHAWPHTWDFLRSPYWRKGLRLLKEVQTNIPIIRGVTALSANGQERIESVDYTIDNQTHRLATQQLILHQGVMPQINLVQAAGIALQWNAEQHYWQPAVDAWGHTAMNRIGIAGDSAGIMGAQASEYHGQLVALEALHKLGIITQNQRDAWAETPRSHWQRATRGRRFFEKLYKPADAFRIPDDTTIVCRCEEVTAGQIRESIALGCTGPNQLKSFLRCGMGPCQGRLCNVTVTELFASTLNISPATAGHYRLRFPTKPITLGELASLPQTPEAQQVVVRLPASGHTAEH